MAIGALLTKNWNGNLYQGSAKSPAKGGQPALQWLANAAPELIKPGADMEEKKEAPSVKAPLSYSRRITASFKTRELTIKESGAESSYSCQASMQNFEILIKVNGDERNYVIHGIDGEGNAFEKEFDPYQIDPENADYTEFTALCLYIQKTEGYADSLMSEEDSFHFAQPDNILEKRNYVSMLATWRKGQYEADNMELAKRAEKLLHGISDFMDERLTGTGNGNEKDRFSVAGNDAPVSEDLLDTLFQQNTEQDAWERSFKQIGKNAPESVRQAWMEAARASGVDGLGTGSSGKLGHISQIMAQRVLKGILKGQHVENEQGILGNSVQSAARVAREALYALEHPLAPYRATTPEAARSREMEKRFYQEFISRLEAL